MKKSNIDSPGGRLRYLRKDLLRLTQQELGDKLELNRTGIANSEAGKQGISRQTLEKLNDLFSVSSAWLMYGSGQPFVSADSRVNVSKHQTKMLGNTDENPVAQLLCDQAAFVKCQVPGRFGYGDLKGTKVRLQAARDEAIRNTELFRLVEDDDLWFVAGSPDGWDFEMMREYFEIGGDRSMPEWMEFLRTIRWVRESLIQSLSKSSYESESKSA